MDMISVLILVLIGIGCGALETRHLGDQGPRRYANFALGVGGALLGGWFFHVWGELAHGLLAPVASGIAGAAIVLPTTNWIAARFGWAPAADQPRM